MCARVAVIGTGASAIQIVPELAREASRLFVFQRTPPWILPRADNAIPERHKRAFRRWPSLQRLVRAGIWSFMEASALGFVVAPRINRAREYFARRFLKRSVSDDGLRAKLLPTYTLGCKRILYSNEYYPALQRENVELVVAPIREVRDRSIITENGEAREVDTIVCATGFEASEAPLPFSLVGRAGKRLEDEWRNGVEAYVGCTVAGFPNFFFLVGPNTGLGHSSMIFMIESQIAYVLDALEKMRDRGARSVELRAAVQRRYNERLQARLERTVWSRGGCTSWYRTPSGKNTTLWPGFTFEFRLRTRRFDIESYDVE